MMSTKKKVAAVGAAALVAVGGYGVYATTLNVNNNNSGFAAGAAKQEQVAGFGTVDILPATPTINGDGTTYSYPSVAVTPGKGADWAGVTGKTLTIQGLNSKGEVVTVGTYKVDAKGQTTVTIALPTGADHNADNVANWSIVVAQ